MKKTLLYHVFPVKGNDVWIKNINWLNNEENFLNEFLHESTQIKNIWIPYGE